MPCGGSAIGFGVTGRWMPYPHPSWAGDDMIVDDAGQTLAQTDAEKRRSALVAPICLAKSCVVT